MAGREVGTVEEQDVQENGGGMKLVHSSGGAASLQARERVAGLLRPVEDVEAVIKHQQEVREVAAKTLQEGRDYGSDHGGKPSLYQPGADTMCSTFGSTPRFEIIESEVDHDREVQWTKRKKRWNNGQFAGWDEESGVSQGVYRYVVACEIVHRASGVVVGYGVGSCSSYESKYVDRPRELENTILKMAKKRAYVDATLTTFGLHDMFTQDLEDMEFGPAGSTGGSRSGGNGASQQSSAPSGGPAFLDSKITDTMSKPKDAVKDLTWREAIAKQKGYVQWVVENYRNITDQQRSTLVAAMDPKKNSGPGSAHDNGGEEEEPKIQKEQIVELRNLAKELGAVESTERYIERGPTLKSAALQIANAKKQLARKREQEEAAEKEEAAAAGQPQDDEGGEEESGSLFDEDDSLPFD